MYEYRLAARVGAIHDTRHNTAAQQFVVFRQQADRTIERERYSYIIRIIRTISRTIFHRICQST